MNIVFQVASFLQDISGLEVTQLNIDPAAQFCHNGVRSARGEIMPTRTQKVPAHNLEYNKAIALLYSEELQQLQSALAKVDFKLTDLEVLAPCQEKVKSVLSAVTAFEDAVEKDKNIGSDFKNYLVQRLKFIKDRAEILKEKLDNLTRPDGGSYGATGFSYAYKKADAVIMAKNNLRESGIKLPEIKQAEGLPLFYAAPRVNYALLPKALKALYELEFDLADIENLEDIENYGLNSVVDTGADASGFTKNASASVKRLAEIINDNAEILRQDNTGLVTLIKEELAGTIELLKAIRSEYFSGDETNKYDVILVDETSIYGRCSEVGKAELNAIAAKLVEKENTAIASVVADALLTMQGAKTSVQDEAYLYSAWKERIKIIGKENDKLTLLQGNEKTATSKVAITSVIESIGAVKKIFSELEENTLAKEIQAVWREAITHAATAHQKLKASFEEFGAIKKPSENISAIDISWVQADAAYPEKGGSENPKPFTPEEWHKINQEANAKLTGLSIEDTAVLAKYEDGNLNHLKQVYNNLLEKAQQLKIENEQLQQELIKLKTLLDELPQTANAQKNSDVVLLEAIRRQTQLCEQISKKDKKVSEAYQATDQAFADMRDKVITASDTIVTAHPAITSDAIDEHRATLINNKKQFRVAKLIFGVVMIASIIGILDYALDFIDGNGSNEEFANALFGDNAQAATSASNATSLTAYDALDTPSLSVSEGSVEPALRAVRGLA